MCFCERISLKFFLSFFTSRSGGSTKMNAGSFVPSNGCTKSSPVEEFSNWYTWQLLSYLPSLWLPWLPEARHIWRRRNRGDKQLHNLAIWAFQTFQKRGSTGSAHTPWDCLTRRSAHFWDARLARIWTTTNFQCVLPRNEQPLVDRFSQSWTIFVQMSFGHYHQYLQDSTVACRG